TVRAPDPRHHQRPCEPAAQDPGGRRTRHQPAERRRHAAHGRAPPDGAAVRLTPPAAGVATTPWQRPPPLGKSRFTRLASSSARRLRRKFTRSCWSAVLSALKLRITAFASDPGLECSLIACTR